MDEFKESAFLALPSEMIAETSLIALTTISYIVPKRPDLVTLFEQSLTENIQALLSPQSILLRCRMSLLLGYYADMLFKKEEAVFRQVMEFLVSSL